MNTILLNWKMQLSAEEAYSLTSKIKNQSKNWNLDKIELGICPDFLSIHKISEILKNTKIKLGAQNCFFATKGAYTGEVSPKFLKEMNVEYILVGHSERRTNLKESDELINKKIKTLSENDLIPVLCVGENFEERKNNQKDLVIINQLRSALKDINLKNLKKLIIAYEPIWVIGSGQAIDAFEADQTSMLIKRTLIDILYDDNIELTEKEFNQKIQILYGGSVDSTNVNTFIDKENIDGVLVGGAGLKFETLNNLINSIKN